MMNTIVQQGLIFVVRDENRVHPIPPRYVVQGRFAFVTRLLSTRGRRAWWFRVGKGAALALNRAPYNPVLRAVVTEFEWSPPGKIRLPVLDENHVVQGGSGTLNFWARVAEPLPDPVRDTLRGLARFAKEPIGVQGRLRIHTIPHVGLDDVKGVWRDYFTLYNHTVCGSVVVAGPRVLDVGREPTAVAVFATAESEVWVLSPDHFSEPCRLGEGVYLLTHPFPRPDREID